jgi:hypothetical protein
VGGALGLYVGWRRTGMEALRERAACLDRERVPRFADVDVGG